jgi:polyhydroxyalkanoate synthase
MGTSSSQDDFMTLLQQMSQQMIDTGTQLQNNAERLWFDYQRQWLLTQELSEALTQLAQHPNLIAEYQQQLIQNVSEGLQSSTQSKDRRFSDEAWEQPGFSQLKSIYLSFCDTTLALMDKIPDLDEKQKQRVKFFVRQWLSAISPSNFLMTNPVAIRETQITGGMNLIKGLQNYLDDWQRGNGLHNVRMTDLTAFQPGKNLAITPGKVIYQNPLMQLIQYAPTSDKVSQRPLLIVPPWINKYYILDLQPENSFVKWVVDQGYTLFIISWVNPDPSLKDKSFEDYMELGILAALDAIEQQTGESAINALGYCLGGTLLGATLGYLKAIGDDRISAATFLTTLLDFTYPGELGCFLSEPQLDILEQQMAAEGVLDGRALALTYNLLRENDLYWSYHVNNYLLGKEPPAFDLLYWNSDATNLPAAMHSFYLRNMYLENRLKDPGGIQLKGVDIDIRQIDIPCYFLSAEKDHIALWESTYLGAQKLSGEVTFVLAGSGHVAGVINPANRGKYSYFTHPNLAETAVDWFANAEQTPGSWWPHWNDWLKQYSGKEVDARDPSQGKLTPIEDAPGHYVLKTL